MITAADAAAAVVRRSPRAARRGRVARSVVGGFFLTMGGVHLGLVAADPQVYRSFADDALFAFVRDGWLQIVMARPEVYGLLLMTGEIVLGSCLLVGGRAARAGWAGVIVFHLLLPLFGWWVLIWVVPFLAIVVPLALPDLVASDTAADPGDLEGRPR